MRRADGGRGSRANTPGAAVLHRWELEDDEDEFPQSDSDGTTGGSAAAQDGTGTRAGSRSGAGSGTGNRAGTRAGSKPQSRLRRKRRIAAAELREAEIVAMYGARGRFLLDLLER